MQGRLESDTLRDAVGLLDEGEPLCDLARPGQRHLAVQQHQGQRHGVSQPARRRHGLDAQRLAPGEIREVQRLPEHREPDGAVEAVGSAQGGEGFLEKLDHHRVGRARGRARLRGAQRCEHEGVLVGERPRAPRRLISLASLRIARGAHGCAAQGKTHLEALAFVRRLEGERGERALVVRHGVPVRQDRRRLLGCPERAFDGLGRRAEGCCARVVRREFRHGGSVRSA